MYFHLSSDGVFLGAGSWRPTSAQLAGIRRDLDNPGRASELHDVLDQLAKGGIALGDGDPVTTSPRGWTNGHPETDLLRRRSFTVSEEYAETPWLHTAAGVDVVRGRWRDAAIRHGAGCGHLHLVRDVHHSTIAIAQDPESGCGQRVVLRLPPQCLQVGLAEFNSPRTRLGTQGSQFAVRDDC